MFKNSKLKMIINTFFVVILTMASASADTEYRVKKTDNLNRIVNQFYQGSELSRSQILLGILAENPKAFKGGNINFLLSGRRLILPDENNFAYISEEDAKELLAEHARFFRNGITGNLNPPLDSTATISAATNPTNSSKVFENKQLEQNKKISQLEQESEALRARLEKLVAEKTASDQKLREIEDALQKSTQKNTAVDTSNNTLEAKKKLNEQIDQKTRALKQSNRVLLQELQQSKSKLAENTMDSIRLERQIADLQGQNTEKSAPASVIEEFHNTAESNSSDKVLTPINNLAIENEAIYKQNYFWPLLIVLFSGIGILVWFIARRNKVIIDESDLKQAVESTYINETSNIINETNNIDEIYEESPLEASIKLDVASAYIEASDTQSALNILQEVMEEGDDKQKQQAEAMQASLRQAV
jgi:FimV-like protein